MFNSIKTNSALILLLLTVSFQSNAQDRTLYTGLINFIPADKHYPVIGFMNLVRGDHSSTQIGFLNHSAGTFRGFQAGFLNTGVVNAHGYQAAFVNQISGEMTGLQTAFINHAKTVRGAQVGFVNHAKTVTGVQMGFINYSDSIVSGIPIGLLYFGKNALLSVDVGFTEMYPVKVSVRTGVEKLYFIINAAYSDNRDGFLSLGAGFGSTIPLNEKSSLNPEFQYVGGLNERNNYDHYSISLNYVIQTSDKLGFVVGPSFGYNLAAKGKSVADNPPFLNLAQNTATSRIQFVAGIRASVRFNLARIVTK